MSAARQAIDPVAAKPWSPPLAAPPVGPVQDVDQLLGLGTDLWADEAEFEAFLTTWRQWRDEDRAEGRQP